MLFDYYLFTVVHIDALCVGLGVESLAVEGVPCLAVEAHLAGAGVQGADGGDFTVGADEAHADGLGQGVFTGRGSGAGQGAGIDKLAVRAVVLQVGAHGLDADVTAHLDELALCNAGVGILCREAVGGFCRG